MPNSVEILYKTTSPVLFVIFNRPDTTKKVFEEIRNAKPARLYIAADGPRAEVKDENINCDQARAIADDIDWDCQVKTLFREENWGCRDGVSAALDWFFANEKEGIILEDDCLPDNSFFKFCDIMLERYRTDNRVRHITGCNLQQGKKWGNASYYFSNRTHVWGWASWKRVWDDYDKTLSLYNNDQVKANMLNIYTDPLIAGFRTDTFKDVKSGKINSWAYPLDFINSFNNGLAIIPNENLISNIGFGAMATHTIDKNNPYANIPVKELTEIIHPVLITPEKKADLNTLRNEFNIDTFLKRNKYLFKRKIKELLNIF